MHLPEKKRPQTYAWTLNKQLLAEAAGWLGRAKRKREHVQFMHSTIGILQGKQTHVCELAPHAFPWQHCSLTYCRNLGDSSKDPSFVRSRGRVIPYSSAAAAADKFGAIPYSSAAAAADKFGVAQFKAFPHMLSHYSQHGLPQKLQKCEARPCCFFLSRELA